MSTDLPAMQWRKYNEGVAVDPARPGGEFTYLSAFPGEAFNRHAARGWNELRRTSRVTLAQWAFIVRNTRHIKNDNERHAARTEAMIILRVGGTWVPR